jgi:parallel beta-helix repeat protein
MLLISMLTLTCHIRQVEASGTIHIRADGSIDPPTAPISTVDNITYTFNSDISDSIIVEKDSIVVDGAGYTVHGGGAVHGVDLSYRYDVTLKNVKITNFVGGIELYYSTNNALIGNTVSGNDWGIELAYSSDNTVIRNIVSSSNLYGIRLVHSSGNALFGNKVFSDSIYGILLSYSCSNNLVGNNVSSNNYGIRVASSSDNNVLTGNNVSHNVRGINLCYSSSNSLIGNRASSNTNGIHLWSSKNNTLTGNEALNNDYGIHLEASSSNTIFHNNLFHNAIQVYVTVGYANIWDNGYPSGGNYWRDYIGTDINHDGIGDIQFEIESGNVDHYPLMGVFHSFNTSSDCYVNVVSNCTIEDFECSESENKIEIQVSNSSVNQKYGFCRICIPKNMFGPNCTVMIDEGTTETLHFNDTIHDTNTHTWIYFAYLNPTHQLIIQTSSEEADSFPTWITIAIILTAVVGTAFLIHSVKTKKATQKEKY